MLEAIVAGARAALDNTRDHPGEEGSGRPRFELFHAASSICSQKVRAVLIHHRLPFVEHGMNLFLGHTYLPSYVRLRMLGCKAIGGALVDRHSGSTSATAGGCDGAVVPTLIDWETGEVIVDSKRICIHLDDHAAAADRLRPPDLADPIDADLDVIDNLPNYQMLMARTVSAAEASATRSGIGAQFSERKVAWCDRYLQECAGDRVLSAAYAAKRSKELSAAETLFSDEAMAAALTHAELALRALETRLAARSTAWLYANRLTMADLFWGIELLRMSNTGFARFWENGALPQVKAFARATKEIPAIDESIVRWPGAVF